MKENYIQIDTTFEKRDDAVKMAKLLLDAKLVADGQITEIHSTFNWEGNFYDKQEWSLSCKTKEKLYQECEKFIKDNHPYKVPQIIAKVLVCASKNYLDWIDESIKR